MHRNHAAHHHTPLIIALILTLLLVMGLIAMAQPASHITQAKWSPSPTPKNTRQRRPRPTKFIPPRDYNNDGRLDEWDGAVIRKHNKE